MPRSTTRTFRSTSRKQDVKWATPSIGLDQNVLQSANLQSQLLVDADWDTLIAFERVTLLRIRGWIAFSSQISTAACGVVGAIWKMPAAVTVPSPLLAASYDVTDTLWTGGAQFAATASNNGQTWRQDIDIKTKRKLDPEDSIGLALRATTAAASVRASWFLRCLWQYSLT